MKMSKFPWISRPVSTKEKSDIYKFNYEMFYFLINELYETETIEVYRRIFDIMLDIDNFRDREFHE